jgi:toxin ParE1/3/4
MPGSRRCLPQPGRTMQHELRFRAAALADLEAIFQYVRQVSASPAVARGYVERIRARCRRIAVLPLAGRPRDDLAPTLRRVAFERRVVIVYRVHNEAVEITNIFHGARDYAALYRQGDPGDGA